MSLEILENKDAICDVINQFSNLECDVHKQAEFFTEDTHIMVHMGDTLAMDIHGRAEMEKQFSAFTSAVKASHHMNGQQVIRFSKDGQTAENVHYCRAVLVTHEGDRDVLSDNYIRYIDTLVKVDGQWKIKIRDQYFVITRQQNL